ncbi:MAG: hypothetical protein IPM11_01330 [Micropruina sp.]|nr:hypothetical protein [Micropruina sp.]
MRTAIYRFWMRGVEETYGAGGGLPWIGRRPYGLWIDLAPKVKGDIDNRVKLLSDVLKKPGAEHDHGLGVVEDDALMKALYVGLCDGLPERTCRVTVVVLTEWFYYVRMRLET